MTAAAAAACPMVRVIVKSTLLALMCSMRPVRRYRVKGGPPGRSPGAYGTFRCADTVDQQPRRQAKSPRLSGDQLRVTFIYAIQSPSLPCGHLCGHSGAALRILARTHTEKPPSSDGGFSVSYRQLRTQADSHRNRASHFADLCLTTWLRRRGERNCSPQGGAVARDPPGKALKRRVAAHPCGRGNMGDH